MRGFMVNSGRSQKSRETTGKKKVLMPVLSMESKKKQFPYILRITIKLHERDMPDYAYENSRTAAMLR